MRTCTITPRSKAEGFAEIRDGNGKLLIAFSSEDINGFWSQLYQRERIIYAMTNRRKNIPDYLRTGELPPHLKLEAIKLRIKNLIRR